MVRGIHKNYTKTHLTSFEHKKRPPFSLSREPYNTIVLYIQCRIFSYHFKIAVFSSIWRPNTLSCTQAYHDIECTNRYMDRHTKTLHFSPFLSKIKHIIVIIIIIKFLHACLQVDSQGQ